MSKLTDLFKEIDNNDLNATPQTYAVIASDKGDTGFIHDLANLAKRLERKNNYYYKLGAICHNIYIARNITFNNESMMDCLKEIDKMFRDDNNN